MNRDEAARLSAAEKRALLGRLLQRSPENSSENSSHDVERPETSPLSPGQQSLWMLQQLAPDSAAYNVPLILRIGSQLDADVLRRSVQELANRHAMFRTVFRVDDGDGNVVQTADNRSVSFTIMEAAGWNDDEMAARVLDESERPFNLMVEPAFRCMLFRRSETESVLLLLWHHIVIDGWSLAVVLEELGAIHAAYAAGLEHLLAPAPPYAEFVRSQHSMLASAEGSKRGELWRRQLDGVMPLDLVTDHKRPPQRSHRGQSLFFTIGDAVTADLMRLAAEHDTTLFVVLLAAFEALLHRMTGRSNIPVSFPVNGRTDARFVRTVGYFVNQVVVAAELDADTTVRDLLAQVKTKVVNAVEQQDYHPSLLPQNDSTGGARYSDVMFVLQKSQGYRLELPTGSYRESAILSREDFVPRTGELGGLRVESFPLESRTARFDLEVQLTEHAGSLLGWLQYDSDLFEEATIRSLVQAFQRVLANIGVAADRRVSELDIMSDDDRSRTLVEWNRTERTWPDEGSVADIFERQTANTPDAIAAMCGDDRLTFAELDARANRVASWLRRNGAANQEIVALCIPRSIEMLIGLLGIVKAGCVYLPLDPSNPDERLKFMLRDAGAEIVVTNSSTCGRFRRSSAQELCLHCDEDQIGNSRDSAPERGQTPLLYLVYTSGSTGEPKGVLGAQAGALNRFNWMWERYPFACTSDTTEVCAQVTTLSFVDAVWEIFGPLLRGVPIAIVPDEQVRDAELLVSALAMHRVTRITLVPSLLRVLLECGDIGARLRSVRYWSCSGEALGADLVREFRAAMPDGILLNLYGCSEAAADSCCFEIDREWDGDRVPVGKPIANTKIFILDDYNSPVPPGVVGQIYVGGVGVAAGYLNRPQLSAERFIMSPLDSAERLYRTGDLGRYVPEGNGNIEYFGRADQQVKIRGNRVELGEVEAAVRGHADVADAAVRAMAEPSGDHAIVAYVVMRSGSTNGPTTDGQLRAYMALRLPGYMLPSHFVRLESLPLTPSGKIDRKALPRPQAAVESGSYVAPRTAAERAIAQVWAQVLDVPRIGIHDDFFEWGGHSIHALQATSRASKLLKHPLSVAALFSFPTVESFAAQLDTQSNCVPAFERRHQLIPVETRGTRSPLFWIPGGAGSLVMSRLRELSRRLGSDQPLYGLGTRRAERMSEIESIPERARAYVELIRELQPNGPYYLVGFCLGGVLAFEVAQQLRGAGEPVAFVGLINTWLPAGSIPRSQWLHLFLQRATHHARIVAKGEVAAPHRYVLRRIRTAARVLRYVSSSQNDAAGGQSDPESGDALRDERLPDDTVLRNTVRVASTYSPARLDGKLHLFISTEPDLAGVSAAVDPRHAWRRVCAEFEAVQLNGGHDEMFDPPLVDQFGEEFGRCLREAQCEASLRVQ